MNLRFLTIIVLIALICPSLAFSQDCQQCKTRRIILYDNQVTVARPTTVDSIYRYWNYFYITGGVKDYVANLDPTRDCIYKLDGAFFTVPDTLTSSISFGMENANTPPAGASSGFTDYILYGVVTGQSVTLNLETGKTREAVKSGVMALPYGFEPIQTGRALAAMVGPMYTTIMDFERRKRDHGEPYAIQPKITLTPAATKLKVNQKTTIDVLFQDCDGAPLKQRHITFTADGGTLKSSDVTTDDQGRGTLEFTAGSSPTLANVTSVYPFETPTGYTSPAEVVPASIQIDKPSTSWYVTATFELSDNSNWTGDGPNGKETGGSLDDTKVAFSALVTNINPLSGQFTSTPLTTSQLVYSGSYLESSYEHVHWDISAGAFSAMSDGLITVVVNASSTKSGSPQLTLSIYKDSYAFNIRKIPAAQTGGQTTVDKSFATGSGEQESTIVAPASATSELGMSVQGANRDTSYSTSETTTLSGTSTTTVTQISQKFSWKDNVCRLTYVKGMREDEQVTGSTMKETFSNQTYTVNFYMTYTGDPPTTGIGDKRPTVPTAFALNQNYPNPFNPSTTIRYDLPKVADVSLKVYDVMGREIATLAQGHLNAGSYVVQWNANVPSGIYFYRLQAGEFVQTNKMIVLR